MGLADLLYIRKSPLFIGMEEIPTSMLKNALQHGREFLEACKRVLFSTEKRAI
jgi:hypothetical protein